MIVDFPDSKTVRKFSVFKATHPVAYCHGSRHQLTHLPRGAVQRAAGDVTGFVGASAGEEQRVPAGQSWSFCNLISDTTSITSVTSSALEVSREVRPTLKGLTGRRDPQGCLRGHLIRKAGGEPTSSGDTQPHGVLIVTADVLRAPAPMQVPAHPSLFIVLPTERRGSRLISKAFVGRTEKGSG